MELFSWHTGFAIGLLLLACVSFGRYRGPSWVRSYTSAGRYYSGLVVYLLSQIFLLYVLSASILSIDSLTTYVTNRWLELSQLRSLTPIVLAGVLAWVLPLVPPGRRFVLWQRNTCRRIAGSPVEAYALSRQLENADFAASTELEATVRSVLIRRGWDPDQSWLPVGQPAQELWFKTSLLYELVREWESEPKYARFLDDTGAEFDVIRKRYDQLSMKVVRTFQTIERFGTVLAELSRYSDEEATLTGDKQAAAARLAESKSELRAGIAEMLSDVRLDIEFLYNDICLLIARAVLTNEKTAGGRFWRLRNAGFLLEKASGTPGWIFPAVFGVVTCVMFLVYAILGTGTNDHGVFTTASRIVMIGTMQVVALLVAILPKQHLGFANIDIHGRTPFDFIVGAGISTFILALPVSLLFRSFIFLDLSKALDNMVAKLPWLVVPCVTSMAIAYLIQDNRWHSVRSEHARRLLDAVFLAFAMSLAALIVIALFTFMGGHAPDISRVFISTFLGFVIGYLVPHSIRDRAYLDDDQLKELARKSRRSPANEGNAVAVT